MVRKCMGVSEAGPAILGWHLGNLQLLETATSSPLAGMHP